MVRRIASVLLAAALVLGLSTAALAAEDPESRIVININNTNVNVNGQPVYGPGPGPGPDPGPNWYGGPWLCPGPMTAGSLMSGLYAPNGLLYVQDIFGRQLACDAPIATGDSIVWRDAQNNLRTTEMVVKGDVLGSGVLNIAQLVRMARALNGSDPLTGVYLLAGDLNGNGYIDIADLTMEAKLLW